MQTATKAYLLAALAALVALLAYAYKTCKFGINKILPASWKNTSCPETSTTSTFVGAYGRTPGMQGCISSTGFNRCVHV